MNKAVLLIGLHILHATYAVEYNIALNKVVTSSNNVTDHLANKANDQDLNTYVQVDNVNSDKFDYPWIHFDLKGVYNITKIIIWPTNYDSDYFLARVFFFVRLTNNTDYASIEILCSYENPVKGVSYNCSRNNNSVKGRYVLLKKNDYYQETLKIAEVVILTEDTDFLVSITGPVEQNHVKDNIATYNALKAIDGDRNSCIWTAQEYAVNRTSLGWWRADLGNNYYVSAVNIYDMSASGEQQPYRGYYSVYVDSVGFIRQQLCSFYNQSSEQYDSFFQLRCKSVLTGRYLTVEKISSAYRPDALLFCEIQVVAIHKEPAYILPTNYIGISTTSTTTSTTTTSTTTKTPLLSLTEIPLTASSTTKTPSTSTRAMSITAPSTSITDLTSLADTCSNNCSSCEQREIILEKEKLITEMEKAFQKKETEKIVIGVVVGLLTAIVFIILGFVGGYMYHQKKNMKPMETNIYERTKEENENQHVYSDLNNTPMKEINTYYNENK